ncbi:hypothetical protein ACIBG7_27290 [Nonomuraea sp. NPDC050328]|uniref:hypothetical protein n=1 Tax=Nonomuraea sp. NPDC050328 TaxID=3364361 RepID=UPI00378E8B6A
MNLPKLPRSLLVATIVCAIVAILGLIAQGVDVVDTAWASLPFALGSGGLFAWQQAASLKSFNRATSQVAIESVEAVPEPVSVSRRPRWPKREVAIGSKFSIAFHVYSWGMRVRGQSPTRSQRHKVYDIKWEDLRQARFEEIVGREPVKELLALRLRFKSDDDMATEQICFISHLYRREWRKLSKLIAQHTASRVRLEVPPLIWFWLNRHLVPDRPYG